MSLPILAIFCTSFCISCQIQQLQHLSIAAAPFPNQDWGTIPAEHDKEKNQRPQLRWDSLLAPAHKQLLLLLLLLLIGGTHVQICLCRTVGCFLFNFLYPTLEENGETAFFSVSWFGFEVSCHFRHWTHSLKHGDPEVPVFPEGCCFSEGSTCGICAVEKVGQVWTSLKFQEQ